MASIPEYTHKINERLEMIRVAESEGLRLRIRRVKDGFYFHPGVNNFVDAGNPEFEGSLDDFWYHFSELFDVPGLWFLALVTLPTIVQDLLFEFESYDFETVEPEEEEEEEPYDIIDVESINTWYERHFFGGAPTIAEPSLCKVFGTLKDVSGKPLAGQKVEAYLNRAGFFTHKAGLIGYAATALTDETGYFELPLVVGLDVTVNVPIVGFSTRGFVPNLGEVELTSQALLSYQPG